MKFSQYLQSLLSGWGRAGQKGDMGEGQGRFPFDLRNLGGAGGQTQAPPAQEAGVLRGRVQFPIGNFFRHLAETRRFRIFLARVFSPR